MNRCKTCGHWKRNTGSYNSQRMGECDSAKWEYEGRDLPDGVVYADYEGLSASLETGEDFGCVHHTANMKLRKENDSESERTCGMACGL